MICRIMGRHHKNARDVLQTSASLETAAFLKFERALFVGVKCPTAPYLMKRSVLCTALSIHLLNCQLLLQLLVTSWCRTRCRKIFHLFLGIPNEKLNPRKFSHSLHPLPHFRDRRICLGKVRMRILITDKDGRPPATKTNSEERNESHVSLL